MKPFYFVKRETERCKHWAPDVFSRVGTAFLWCRNAPVHMVALGMVYRVHETGAVHYSESTVFAGYIWDFDARVKPNWTYKGKSR